MVWVHIFLCDHSKTDCLSEPAMSYTCDINFMPITL